MTAKKFANAPQRALSSPVDNVATSIVLDSITGFPTTFPYNLTIDPGLSTEEIVLATANPSGTTLTVTRGYDSTTAASHSVGAKVEHGWIRQDAQETNDHVNATSAVHGITGSFVDTQSTQTISGQKTFTGGLLTGNGAVVDVGATQTITGPKTFSGNNTHSGTSNFTGDVTLPATVNTPRGIVGYQRSTADSGSSSGADLQIAVLGVAFAFVSGRRYEIRAHVHSLPGTTGGVSVASLRNITDGVHMQSHNAPSAPTTAISTHSLEYIYEPGSSGSRTMQVWLASTSGTIKMDHGTGYESFLSIRDLGEV